MGSWRAFLASALVLSVVVCAVASVYSAPREAAVAASAGLLATSCLLLVSRPKITHANTIFIALFIIYGTVLPWLYVNGRVAFDQGSFFVHDWKLLTRGNLIAEAGLLAYGAGLWIARRTALATVRRPARVLSYKTGCQIIVALAVIGALSWFIMFAHEGFPLSSLLGRPAHDRARIASITAGGWGYFSNLSFASTIAFLLYVWLKPKRSLFAPSMLVLQSLIWVSNGLIGSRLLLVMPLIGAIYIRLIQTVQARQPVLKVRKHTRRRLMQLAAAVAVLFVITMAYETYRTGPAGSANSQNGVVFKAADSFSTAGTYYLVLAQVPSQIGYWYGREVMAPALYLVPRIVDEQKYNQIWDAIRFTKDFYGYDETQNNTNAQGPDLLADAYINGGLVGVLAILFAFGVCNEWVSQAMASRPRSPFIGVAFVLYTTIFLQEALKTGVFAAITFSDVRFFPLLVAYLWVRRTCPRADPPVASIAAAAHSPSAGSPS